MAVDPGRLAADGESSDSQPDEQQEHHGHAGEPELFGDHCEQEVGVRFRQIEQFSTLAPDNAVPFAAAEGDQGVESW